MANEEPQNNSNLFSKVEKDWMEIYGLDYNRTQWGSFFLTHQEQGQLQLQKALEKTKNELNSISHMDDRDRCKFTQHLFYKTELNADTGECNTPAIVLRHTKNGYNDSNWASDVTEYRTIQKRIMKSYVNKCTSEYNQVQLFYFHQKNKLELEQKQEHRIRANEKTCCPVCRMMVARTNLARHQKTSKKCLGMSNDEP